MDESEVMKNDAKTKDDASKPVVVTVSTAAEFKNRKHKAGSSLTLREYKDLSTKDRLTLTPSEQKRLTEAQEQIRKVSERLTSQYDFSGFAKALSLYNSPSVQQTLTKALAIDTTPMLKIVNDMQKLSFTAQPALTKAFDIQASLMPAIDAIYKSTIFTQNQFTALAAIQKSLVAFPTENILASIKGIQDAFQAPFIARTMFADFQTMHERIVRNLTFDIGSLTASIEFTRFETVDVAIDDVDVSDESLTATAVATQSSSVGNVTFADNASLLLAFNDLKQEVRDLRQQLLPNNTPQTKQLVSPSSVHFQRTSSSIQIGSFKVSVSVSSKQTQFARVLLNTPENITKRWDIEDLIFQAFGERIEDEHDWIIKIRSYIHQLNQKVLIASGGTIPNFFVLDGVEVYVNPEHINL